MFSKIKLFDRHTANKNSSHYYLSVVISLSSVETAVWEMITEAGGGYNIVGHSRKDLTDPDQIERLVTESIDEAGKDAGVDFEDAVFGLPNSWIDKEEILPSHEHLVDKLCKDLEIEPIAFVPIDSAVSYFLASKLGGPITANLVEVGYNKVSVSVINSGTVKYSQDLKKTTDIPQAVFDLFNNSKSENLPARFIIFGASSQDELAEIENEFNNFNWLQKTDDYAAFLHIPKVTAVTDFSLAEAVAMSTASDFAAQDEFQHASQNVEKSSDEEIIDASPLPDEPQVVTPFPEEEPEENSFGFVQGEDIAELNEVPVEKKPTVKEITAEPESSFPQPGAFSSPNNHALTNLPPTRKLKGKPRVSFNIFAPLLALKPIKRHKTVFTLS